MAINQFPATSATVTAGGYINTNASSNGDATTNTGANTDNVAAFTISTGVNLTSGMYLVSGLYGSAKAKTPNSNTVFTTTPVAYLSTSETNFTIFAPTTWTTNTTSWGASSVIRGSALAWGSDKYVLSAVKSGAVPITRWSTNGTTWTSTNGIRVASGNEGQEVYKIKYLNNTWFALYAATGGTSYAFSTSTDGITWTSRDSFMQAGASTYDAAYGNNIYLIVGTRGGTAITNVIWSTNGTTWSTRFQLFGTGTSLLSISYGPSGFVVPHPSSGVVALSTDGLTWTTSSTGLTGDPYHNAYDNGQYMLTYTKMATVVSTNGTTWTIKNTGDRTYSGQYINNTLIYANPYWIASASTAGGVALSTDGTNWSLKNGCIANGVAAIATNGINYVATGQAPSSTEIYFFSTSDTPLGKTNANIGVIWERKSDANQVI